MFSGSAGEKKLNEKKAFQQGFTLVELMVVVMIISILALIAIPIFNYVLTTARQKALLADLHNIERVSWLYYFHTGDYPQGEEVGEGTAEAWNEDSRKLFVDFEAEHGTNPDSEEKWGGPYLDKWPNETPIGGIYAYRKYPAYVDHDSPDDAEWVFENVRNYAVHTESGDDKAGQIPPGVETEFIKIRYNYIGDDVERKQMRDEALEFLLDALGPKRVYYVPTVDDDHHNTGWIGIRIFR